MRSATTLAAILHWVLFLQFAFALSAQNYDENSNQIESLLQFKSSIIEGPKGSLSNWNPKTHDLCNWTGIICSSNIATSVTAINLTGMGLSGTVSPFLGNLSSLKSIDLFDNNFHGQIPRELSHLSQLEYLNIKRNQLDGPIPSSIGNLTRLTALDLSENRLTGIIPPDISMLSSLQILRLLNNSLQGSTVLEFLLNISTLEEVNLGSNDFWGKIPYDLCAKLPKLRVLKLFENQFTGDIPNSIGNCSQLRMVILNNNRLSGSVPIEVGRLKFLQRLKIHQNQLGRGKGSRDMDFITALYNCSFLEHLTVGDNMLSGILPSSIGKLSSNLKILYLTNNSITGTIPSGISNLTKLLYLSLNWNQFSGQIPSLARLQNLGKLELQRNDLEGHIPEDFGKLNRLFSIDLSFNKLSGQIRASLGRLEQLRRIYLHGNRFSGSIPVNIGDGKVVEKLDLSYNRFNGSIPKEIVQFSGLEFFLNLSHNQLEGNLPPEIGNLRNVISIDVSQNRLSGTIPDAIVNCDRLEYLNLSGNSFSGEIPRKLDQLRGLIHLNLSSNNLSGMVPIEALKKLKNIQILDLSYNNLAGEIPEGNITGNETAIVLLKGNPNLCGASSHYSLPSCQRSTAISTILKKVLFAVLAALVLMFCIVGFYCLQRRNGGKLQFRRNSFEKKFRLKIPYQDLFKATNGFAQENMFAQGDSGSVYKGLLPGCSAVAIKVFNIQNSHAQSRFRRECEILQKARHRNIVRVVGCCSEPNFKALIFKLMPNGDLDKLLHQHENSQRFGLLKRLRIATDIACAIEYLHHDCFVKVVHCDIKPANVLVDGNLTGHLADFGISRSFATDSSASFIVSDAVKGTLGYIAPERLAGRASMEADVYSYGILLLEMMTGKRPTDEYFGGDLNLHSWVNNAYPERLDEVIDDRLMKEMMEDCSDEYHQETFKICTASLFLIALQCSRKSFHDRPTMRDVSGDMRRIRDYFEFRRTASASRLRHSIDSFITRTDNINSPH